METVYVFVDNSNIWIQGKKVSGRKMGMAENNGYRIDYGNLLGVVQDGRFLAREPNMYGSEPPPNDSVWEAIRRAGFDVNVLKRNVRNKEKGVDMEMGMDIAQLIYSQAAVPGTIIIVSGDADFVPAVARAQEAGWSVEVWYWAQAARDLKNTANRFENLDDRVDDVGFSDTR